MPRNAWKPLLLALFAVLLCTLLWSIVVASRHDDVLTGLAYVWADPWGVATLIDLAVGLALVAGWILAVEPRRWLAALLIVLLCCLGNVTTLVYLMARTVAATAPRDVLFAKP